MSSTNLINSNICINVEHADDKNLCLCFLRLCGVYFIWHPLKLPGKLVTRSGPLRFKGFADYGLDNINEDPKAATDQLADHCLVFICRPYRSSLVQSIAVFATKGAAPGHIISRLLLKAIVALETFGDRVTSVTCDGAQTNKTAKADCGMSGTRDKNCEISRSMEHSTAKEPEERIWFLQDVPHLYKCIKNFICSRRTLVKAKRKITKNQKEPDAAVTESEVQLKGKSTRKQKEPDAAVTGPVQPKRKSNRKR